MIKIFKLLRLTPAAILLIGVYSILFYGFIREMGGGK